MLVSGVKNLNPPELSYDIELITSIECIESDLSGITYNPDTDTFFVVTNYPPALVEISAAGECLDFYALTDFDDTEDLYYFGDNSFLIIEERKQILSLIQLESSGIKVLKTLIFNFDVNPNRGLEGVAYSDATNAIYLVNEKPQKILKITNWKVDKAIKTISRVDAFWAKAIMNDYSAITTHDNGFLVLSDESSRLLKLDNKGRIIAGLELTEGPGSYKKLPQAEGVAVGQNENIYIVSEPNHLYVYKKKPALMAGFLAFAD